MQVGTVSPSLPMGREIGYHLFFFFVIISVIPVPLGLFFVILSFIPVPVGLFLVLRCRLLMGSRFLSGTPQICCQIVLGLF